ncbi:MAG: DUF86 domain-containing protein [Victivallales bacterium]|nr:DUF86 domain-containing protein [Victivallales bacterium]
MRGSHGDDFYLESILKAIKSLEGYSAVGRELFLSDQMRQDAVICRLGVIGEAVKRLSDEFRSKYQEVPWKPMAALRDVLVHNYFGVDLEIIWGILERDLPSLKEQLAAIPECKSIIDENNSTDETK